MSAISPCSHEAERDSKIKKSTILCCRDKENPECIGNEFKTIIRWNARTSYFFLPRVKRERVQRKHTTKWPQTLAFTFFSERGWGPFKRKQDVCHSAELVFSHSHPSVLRARSATKPSWPLGVSSSSYSNDYHTTTTTNSRDGLRAGCERRTRTATETIVSSVLTLALSTQGVRARTYMLSLTVPVFCVFKGSRILPYILSPITLHANVRSIVPIVGVGWVFVRVAKRSFTFIELVCKRLRRVSGEQGWAMHPVGISTATWWSTRCGWEVWTETRLL